MKLLKILMVMGVLAFGTVANATTVVPNEVLDFRTGVFGTGGTITLDQSIEGVDNYIGVGILIGGLALEGIPGFDDGRVIATDARLDFNTERNTLTIVGSIAELEISNATLFSGGFTDFGYETIYGSGVWSANGGGNAGVALLNALELPAGGFTYVAFSLETSAGNVISTDLLAERAGRGVPEVPVPAAAWLFGSGLLGLMGVARRKV